MMEDRSVQPADFSRPRLPLLLTALLAAMIAGCSSNQGVLRLTSQDGRHELVQKFSHAYIARSDAGDADIVLIQDQPSQLPAHQDCEMPRQLLHIRVFWTPMNGVRPDHPVNTNASIHWCLICDEPDRSGTIDYQGLGLVDVNDSADGADVTIRKAWMKVGFQHGQLVDPLGPSILRGSFHAIRNPSQVKAILAQIKSAAKSGSPVQAKSLESPQPKNLVVN
jgi:hypothetical protein